jgi:anti-sigma regulatory factor (Ser/Thr protein kinase)
VVANPVVGSAVPDRPVVGSTVAASMRVSNTLVASPVPGAVASNTVITTPGVPDPAACGPLISSPVLSATAAGRNPRSVRADSGWGWLRRAAEMAALAGALPSMTRTGPCFPRIAMKTPGTEPGSISAARRFTALMMQRWGAAERSADVSVVVSELLSNAVRHGLSPARPRCGAARPDIRLGLLHSGPGILCAVTDPSGQLPVPRSAGCLDEGGRGLHVIASLSDCWGSCLDVPGAAGKVVWATFLTAP